MGSYEDGGRASEGSTPPDVHTAAAAHAPHDRQMDTSPPPVTCETWSPKIELPEAWATCPLRACPQNRAGAGPASGPDRWDSTADSVVKGPERPLGKVRSVSDSAGDSSGRPAAREAGIAGQLVPAAAPHGGKATWSATDPEAVNQNDEDGWVAYRYLLWPRTTSLRRGGHTAR